MKQRVYLESSRTQIYDRISRALGNGLAQAGLEVFLVNPAAFNAQSYDEFLGSIPDAWYVSNANSNAFQQKIPSEKDFFFEKFPGRMVFLHQDSLLGGMSVGDAFLKIGGWQRVKDRSVHLTIEPGSVEDLAAIGIASAKEVFHASEFAPVEPAADGFLYTNSFVGHVVPGAIHLPTASATTDEFVRAMLDLRRRDLSVSLKEPTRAAVERDVGWLCEKNEAAAFQLAHREWLRDQVTRQSMPFRGWLLECADLPDLHVFGGDPAYLHGVERSLTIIPDRVTTHPAVYDPAQLREIYRRSKVSVNISSLQFDHAVVNRFHDVFMAGGFCLTDFRPGLPFLTRFYDRLSFRTADELREKARYFSDPDNIPERNRIVAAVQAELSARSSYKNLVGAISESISGAN